MDTKINDWNTRAVILAAGKATRFKTKKTKLLFNICGRSMILYPMHVFKELQIPMTLVLGYQADDIKQEIERSKMEHISYVTQEQQLGTGHAVKCSASTWDTDNILVINGDCPLVTKEIIHRLLVEHTKNDAVITFCTTMVINPTGYGRVIEKNGKIRIIEDKNCTAEQQHINRINAGIYLVSRQYLKDNISKIEVNQTSGEIYFVDLIKMASDQGLPINTIQVPYDNVRGVNTLQDLWSVEQIKRSESIKYWMSEGVRFDLAQSIHIDINVEIGPGSFIGTGVHLLGDTKVGEECFVAAFSILENTTIGDNCTIHSHSVIQDTTIGNKVHVGPFARLRNNVTLGNEVTIGNFVEIKDTKIGNNTKTKHLSYLGNAEIGKEVNIGAGTILCNYDGFKKHKTIIEDNAFIGSNNTLIAPISIGKGTYTAGGSTLKGDIPANSLAIGRSKQEIKVDYAKQLRNQLEKENSEDENNDDKSQKEAKKTINFRGAIKTTTEPSESL